MSHNETLRAECPNPRMARAFADYAQSVGIRVQVVDGAQASWVVLVDDDSREHFIVEWQRFLEEPSHPRYLAASWEQGEATGDSQAAIDGWYRSRRHPLKALRAGPVTWGVSILCVASFLALSVNDAFNLWQNFRFFGTWEQMSSGAEPWRWITPGFIHMSLLHIGFNLLWWWDLAGNIERYQGSLRIIGVFVVFSVAANLAQFWTAGANFGGLSGVVYGLLGYLWAFSWSCPRYPQPVTPFIMRFMLAWLVICMTGLVGPVANGAHVGGLVAGLALGCVWGLADRRLWAGRDG